MPICTRPGQTFKFYFQGDSDIPLEKRPAIVCLAVSRSRRRELREAYDAIDAMLVDGQPASDTAKDAKWVELIKTFAKEAHNCAGMSLGEVLAGVPGDPAKPGLTQTETQELAWRAINGPVEPADEKK